jgi:hypothetical protein
MIPQKIISKYQNFDNPFRKLFFNNDNFVGCDFSDYIPSWKIELSKNFDQNLIDLSIKNAESKGYFSFYCLIEESQYKYYLETIKRTRPEYIVSIEEIIPSNEKPKSILFWDWIFENTSYSDVMLVVLCIYPQLLKNDL